MRLQRRRHWSPDSQTYASADILLQYLDDGWKIGPVVSVKHHGHAGRWRVHVYYFELIKASQTLILPVQGNPVVQRLLTQH